MDHVIPNRCSGPVQCIHQHLHFCKCTTLPGQLWQGGHTKPSCSGSSWNVLWLLSQICRPFQTRAWCSALSPLSLLLCWSFQLLWVFLIPISLPLSILSDQISSLLRRQYCACSRVCGMLAVWEFVNWWAEEVAGSQGRALALLNTSPSLHSWEFWNYSDVAQVRESTWKVLSLGHLVTVLQ